MPIQAPRHTRATCVGAAVCFALALAPSQSQAEPKAPERTAVEHLRRAEDFMGTEVGYGGSQPATVTALRIIVEQPRGRALTLLQELLREATPAGKLYALCGLYKLDKAAFQRALPPFLTDETPVGYCEGGCLVGGRRVREVIRSDSRFALRLPLDGSLGKEAWLKTQPWSKYALAEIDIVGGGWPLMLFPDGSESENWITASKAALIPLDELVASLADDDGRDSAALNELSKKLAAHGVKALPTIKALLKSENRAGRFVALSAIAWSGCETFGAQSEIAAAALASSFGSTDDAELLEALGAYRALAPWNTAARADLAARLGQIPRELNGDLAESRRDLFAELIGAAPIEALPALKSLIPSKPVAIADAALWRCVALGPQAGSAREAITRYQDLGEALSALGEIGLEPGDPAVAFCVKALEDRDEDNVTSAIEALATLGSKAPGEIVLAVAAVAKRRSDSRGIVAEAALARRAFTGATKGLVRALLPALFGSALAEHLTTTRLANPEDLAALREALTGEDPNSRATALSALAEVGPLARELGPELMALTRETPLSGREADQLAAAVYAVTGDRAWPCRVAAKTLESDVVGGLRRFHRYGPIPINHVEGIKAVIPQLEAAQLWLVLRILRPLGPACAGVTRGVIRAMIRSDNRVPEAIDALAELAKANNREAADELHALAEGPKDDLARYLAREAVTGLDPKRKGS